MEGDTRSVNSELWHACAGPRISLPSVGSLVVYFPQGHSEQVAASTLKEVDGHIPNYPNLQSQLVCQLHNVALHADVETDEVFAQMTLQPINDQEKELFLPPDVGTQNRQPNDFFCKTLTASDTSTHGGFSVPRRAAEKVFPLLDFSKQPPAQELRAKDLHDHVWTFRHIYRGQPKRHLLTTGWSVFVSAKRLVAGDSVLFIRDDKGQLLLGIRRANSRQQAVMPSSVLSSDSMHIGVLAAAAHAAATSSRFQVFYNPRTSPSEFVIPLSKYRKSVHFAQVSVGMRFRMVFETEESTLRRYMGTVTGIGDLDPMRWPGSKWRNLEVGWDESSAAERPRRVSLWEIEPVSTPFLICPPSFALRPKRPPGLLGDEADLEGSMKRCLTLLRGENSCNSNFMTPVVQGMGGESSWLHFQQRAEPAKSEIYSTMTAASLQDMRTLDASKVLQQSSPQQKQLRVTQQRPQPMHHLEAQQQPSHILWPQQANSSQQVLQSQQQLPSLAQHVLSPTQAQAQLMSSTQTPTVPLATQLTVTQPQLPMPLVQSCLPSPSSHPLYSSQFQHQQQQQQQHQQHPLQPPYHQAHHPQLVLQSSPQGQLQQSPQVQSHQSLSKTLTVLSHVQPTLTQAIQSLTQSHQQHPMTQAQISSPLTPQCLPHTQQSLSQSQPSLSQMHQPNAPTGQLCVQSGDLPSGFPQISFARSPSPLNLPSLRQLPPISEPDVGFFCSSSSTNYSPLQTMLGRTQGITFSSDDSGQLTNSLRPSQNMTQQSFQKQQNVSQQQHAIVQPGQPVLQQQQLQQIQEALAPTISNLPQIETQLTGSWFGPQCESPMLSNAQLGQSDTSSAITTSSFPLASEALDNPLLVPTTAGTLQSKVNSMSKEGQCRPINDTVMGSFSSSSGSFTSATTEGNRVNSGLVTNGVLEETVLPRPTCSWSQVAAPVRTFTKVHISGSDVGRSIDLSKLKDYDELRWELARMFHIEGQLEDPPRSYWQLVFVDNVGDILLVGDDPWDEFVSCVRAIKILSTAQFLQMNQEGLEQLTNLPLQQQSSSSEDCQVWKDM